MEAHLENIKREELNRFVLEPQTFIKGFLSRREAANEALRQSAGKPSTEVKRLAEIAALYNQLLNAAVAAFKGDAQLLLETLEGGK